MTAVTWLSSQSGLALAAGGNSVYRTTDNGATWAPVLSNLPASPARFAVDPTNPSRALVSVTSGFTSTSPGTIYHSEDGGLTFAAITQPASSTVGALTFSPDGSLLYGGSAGLGAMYVSSDFGAHWTNISAGLPGAGSYEVYDIAVDPSNHNTLYAAIAFNPSGGQGGVYRSDDGGQSWAPTSLVGLNVFRIALDPTNPARLLAAANLK